MVKAPLGWVRWAKEEGGGVGMNQVSHNMNLAIQSHAMEYATVFGVSMIV